MARRVVAEARDHLQEATSEVGDDEAIRGFGPPRELAALGSAEVATTATRVAALAMFAALGIAGLVYAVLSLTLPLLARARTARESDQARPERGATERPLRRAHRQSERVHCRSRPVRRL